MITKKQMREWLGHNGSECRVRITRTGEVHRYGSPDPYDRSQDYWMYLGEFINLARDYARQQELERYALDGG